MLGTPLTEPPSLESEEKQERRDLNPAPPMCVLAAEPTL